MVILRFIRRLRADAEAGRTALAFITCPQLILPVITVLS